MRLTSVLGFVALIAAPALHAELVAMVRGEQRARFLALSGAVSTFVIACLVSGSFFAAPEQSYLYATLPLFGTGHALHFVVDSLNGPLLPMLTLLTLAIVMGGPASLLSKGKLRSLLWLESLTLLTLTSADLALLALGWALVIIPRYQLATGVHGGTSRLLMSRVFKIYHVVGLSSFLLGCGLLAYYTRPSGFFDMSLLHLDTGAVPASVRPIIFAGFCIGGLVRMGVAPVHSWLPASLERGSLLSVAFLVSMRTGLYMLARLAIPAFPDVAHGAMPLLTTIALFSAMYGALAALGQYDLRRMVGFLIVSQSGIMLTGLVFGDAHAVSGTLLYWLGFATATTGLVLMVAALTSRTGVFDMRKLGGIVRRVPNLSACFFLFGLATIAIPGTVAFAAEDMLVHGALEAHPLLTIVMILAMVLNAITVVRAFAMTFLGNRNTSDIVAGTLEDLLPRERFTAVALLVALVCAGIYPQALVSVQQAAAKQLAFLEHASGDRE